MSGKADLPVVSLPAAPPMGLFARINALSGDQVFWRALAITTILKLLLVGLVPITGDEAYFVIWGENLDYGYYDHGAMTGWWLAATLWLGKNEWTVRLPAVLTSVAVGFMIWRTLRPIDAQKAGWVATLYLWSPHSVLNIFMTTDTPLIFFSALSGVFAFRACRDDRKLDFLLAGVFLGLAFLSKYFAVLLGVAYAVIFLFCVGRPRIVGLLLTFIGVLPSAAVNIAWNYSHGWSNIVFNLYNRQDEGGFTPMTPVLFLGTTLLLLGPLAWYLFRPRFPGRQKLSAAWAEWKQTGLIVFAMAFLIPQVVFLLVSFTNRVGVHWPLSFYAFAFLTLPALFTPAALRRMANVMAVIGVVLVVGLAIGVSMPVELAKEHPSYASIIMGTSPYEVLSRTRQINPDALIATPSYSKSALLGFYHDRYVPVLGEGSHHARQDDFLTDLRELERKDILIITHKMSQAEECFPWFRQASVQEFALHGTDFFVVDGRGFRYPIYHRRVLRDIAKSYYRIPSWLASWSPVAPFLSRYHLLPAGTTE